MYAISIKLLKIIILVNRLGCYIGCLPIMYVIMTMGRWYRADSYLDIFTIKFDLHFTQCRSLPIRLNWGE